jgi:hypothetical protein
MNLSWLKSHSATPNGPGKARGLVRGRLLCHFELTAVCEERGTRNSQKALISMGPSRKGSGNTRSGSFRSSANGSCPGHPLDDPRLAARFSDSFLAERKEDNEAAVQYLNTRLRGEAAAVLAHQLFVVLPPIKHPGHVNHGCHRLTTLHPALEYSQRVVMISARRRASRVFPAATTREPSPGAQGFPSV